MPVFRIPSFDPRFPQRLRYFGGPSHVEAVGPLAEQLDSLPHPIAIVGTRRASNESLRFAKYLAASLARAGATIVSGGAMGIDAAAHEGALEVKGRTVAVLPTSVEKLIPVRNTRLLERVRDSGALVAFRESHEQPRFHERNAAIVALVEDVIMAAAPFQSGARNTAAEARARDKTLWVVPGSPWDPEMEGCALELTLGARALISPEPLIRKHSLATKGIRNNKLVVRDRAWQSRVTPHDEPASLFSSRGKSLTQQTLLPGPDERRLRDALAQGAATVDELVLRTGLPVAPVRALLLTWSIEGVVREGPVGLFRLVSL